MTVSYEGLWKLLKENRLRKQDLVEQVNISSATIAKMSKGEMVSGKVIDRICEYLACGVKDIIELQ